MKLILLDTEGDNLLPQLTLMWCAVAEEYDTGVQHVFTPENIDSLPQWLEQWDGIIAHNLVGYDLPALRKLYNWEYKGQMIDTLLMSRTQRPNRLSPPGCYATPHSIEAYGYRFGSKKKVHEDWTQFSPEMLERCKQDVALLRATYNFLLEEGKGEGWERAHKLNARLFYILQKQEEYGWLVDRPWMDHCISTLDRWIDRIDRVVAPHLPLVVEPLETKIAGEYGYVKKPFKKDGNYSQAAFRFFESMEGIPKDEKVICGPFSRIHFRSVNLNSNEETKNFLLSQGWQPEEWNVNDNGEQTSAKLSKDDSFEGIQGSLGRLIAKRVQCRHRRSQIEGWIANIREDGRIGARVGGVATTGRIRHGVIVNVPSPTTKSFFAKWMRKCFIAKEGWVLVGTDSKSNQVRQLAARLGDSEFTNFVLSGADIHERNRQLSGVPTRTIAKNLYYGTIFGAGDKKIGGYVEGGAEQGKRLKEEFFKALPTFPGWLEKEKEKWRQTARKVWNPKFRKWEYRGGFIYGLDGRPIQVEFEKDICVFYLQADEAIQMATAYCWFYKQMERRGYKWGRDWGYVIWMHDEWQIECRKEIVDEVIQLSNRAVEWAGEFYGIKCKHEGESKAGLNWTETH